MSKSEDKVASGAGIAVNGTNPISQRIQNAMVSAALAGFSAGNSDAEIRAAVDAARLNAKSVQS